MENIKTTFNFSNWFENNSPKLIQIIGDIGLLAAFITTNILVFKQSLIDLGLTQIANSPMFDKVNTICLTIGIFIKLISKFFGKQWMVSPLDNSNSQPVKPN